jgi:hypothetical protein
MSLDFHFAKEKKVVDEMPYLRLEYETYLHLFTGKCIPSTPQLLKLVDYYKKAYFVQDELCVLQQEISAYTKQAFQQREVQHFFSGLLDMISLAEEKNLGIMAEPD